MVRKAKACTIGELKELLNKFDDEDLVFFDVLGVDELSSAVIDANTLHDTRLPIEDYGHSIWIKLRENGMFYGDIKVEEKVDTSLDGLLDDPNEPPKTDSCLFGKINPRDRRVNPKDSHRNSWNYYKGKLVEEFDDDEIPF